MLTGGNTYSQEHPTGVENAREGHHLASGWIPAQCELARFTFDEFRALKAERDITEGDKSSLFFAVANMRTDTEPDVRLQPPSSVHQFDPIACTDTFMSYPTLQGNQ